MNIIFDKEQRKRSLGENVYLKSKLSAFTFVENTNQEAVSGLISTKNQIDE